MGSKKEIISYIDSISIFLLGITFLAFPLLFLTVTTDAFTLPKQILLGTVSLLIVSLYAVKIIVDKKVVLRRTPFDLPVAFLIIAGLLSAIFSINRADALITFVTFLFSALSYFLITNNAKDKSSVNFLNASLALGGLITAIISSLSFFKIYVLPFSFTHSQLFNTFGSSVDQPIYLIVILATTSALSWSLIRKIKSGKTPAFEKERIETLDGGFFLATLVLLVGAAISVYATFKLQPPVVLPLETGFQTAFSEISQDTGRVAQGFIFGSGIGTYNVAFSRFKPVSFNQNANLWSLTFIRSSSFVLETLATMGVLGIAAFAFLLFKIWKEKSYFWPLILVLGLSFVVPFSFVLQTLLFILLGLYAARQGLDGRKENKYFDVEPHFVTLRRGILSLSANSTTRGNETFLPVIFVIVLIILVGTIGFFSGKYIISDITFQKSLVSASQNNGSQTYTYQAQAIGNFQYRDAYFRIFSQTNLALATSLATNVPQGSSPSAQVQQTILTLTQQSINAARQATIIAPQTAANWSNLSSIYRSLIGFGQNADQFAIASQQQATLLDPSNPNEYINLGGIFYQLGQWDQAQTQFQTAIGLKPDLANSYYNLGHTLEQKGDLKGALAQYQNVQNLVQSDKTNLTTIKSEIDAIQKKIEEGGQTAGQGATTSQLPIQNPPVTIPSPPATSSAK